MEDDKTLIGKVRWALSIDLSNWENQSILLEKRYEEADEDSQRDIDECFFLLCGSSLKNLIAGKLGR